MKKKWEKERDSSEDSSYFDEARQKNRCVKLPRNPRQRRIIIAVIFLIICDIIYTLLDFYEPLKFLIEEIDFKKEFNLSSLDLIVYSTKEVFDIILGLGFLFMGYKLSLKYQENQRKSRRLEMTAKKDSELNDNT